LFVKPAPLKTAVPGGYSLDDFAIDTAAGTVACPAGHTALSATGGRHRQRRAAFTGLCAACPLRARCTTAKTGRIVTIAPTTTSRPPPDAKRPPTRPGRTPTAAGAHRSNAPWPGSSPEATAACAWLHTRAAALNLRTLINLGLTRANGHWTIAPAPAN